MSTSIFSGISTTVLQGWLTDSQNALQQLALGKQVVRVQTGEKGITFTSADVDKLKAHIRALQSAIAINSGSSGLPYSVATWTR
jgi:uncharacterized 2Fe-2S/4Fe-4S cluster protein (DUF4445 family)